MAQASPDALFKALSDPTRRSIYERLTREGELSVGRLQEGSGVSQPAVSKHLIVLKGAGLVRARPDGRQTHYAAEPKALAPLVDWMAHYGAFWEGKFDALEDLLRRMDQ